jgi:DNA end-binding protein Ku
VRAMWKGSVSFGLVNVPVKMYTATSSQDVSFHQVHREDGGRIRYKRVCSVCGEEVSYDEIAKGYEADDGQMVILTDEDLADLPIAGGREIEVERFVPAEQIDPMLLEKSYYLQPENTGAKPYALLREVLEQSDKMALVHVAIRTRSVMAVLRVRDDVIVMQTMMWPDEVRQPDFENIPDGSDLKPQEIAMAASLVDSLSGDYDAEEFSDEYRVAVESLIEAKLSKGETEDVPAAEKGASDGGGEVIDLLAALQRSVDEASSRRSGSSSKEKPAKKAAATKKAAEKAPAKKAAATKTAAKKAATKKTAAKKTAARKSA